MANTTYSTYIGIPFKSNGRTKEAFDCWGLVMELYETAHGVVLPDFTYGQANHPQIGAFFIDELYTKSVWEEVPPAEGAIVVFVIAGVARHVGFMIDNHHFIHTIRGCSTVIEDIRGIRWSGRYKGCYKWRQEL